MYICVKSNINTKRYNNNRYIIIIIITTIISNINNNILIMDQFHEITVSE